MPSPGRALATWDAPLFDVDQMIGQAPDAVADDLINDYVWAASLYPVPVSLDYTWLVQPLAWRPVPPINSVTVSRTGAGSAYVSNDTSTAEYGVFDPGGISLESAVDADPVALGTFLTTYEAGFFQRPPVLTFDLLERTTSEAWAILAVVEGSRIVLANTPSTWPAECLSVYVDGISHEIGLDSRLVRFACSPLVGQAAGQVGPWFTADRSTAGGTDVAPY